MGIIEFDFKSLKAKLANSLLLLQKPSKKREMQMGDAVASIVGELLERECVSL